MVTLRNKCTWNNLRGMLLKGSLLWYVFLRRPSIDLSKAFTHGSTSSPNFCSLMVSSPLSLTLRLCASVLQRGVVLALYVDDIILKGSDEAKIAATKTYLCQHFVTRDLSPPRYFLGLEMAYRLDQIALCQRKYALDLLEETGMLGCKPVPSPMETNIDWWDKTTSLLEDSGQYCRLIGKLIHLIVTRPNIAYAVSVLSQFMQAPRVVHLNGVYRVLAYIKRAPGKGLLYQRHRHLHVEAYSDAGYAGDKADRKSHCGYATYVGGNLVTWRSQKQYVVSLSSA